MGPVLSGIRVVDLTAHGAGPYCTMLLGDMGAEVIKVEPPGGEHSRDWGSWSRDGKSLLFMALNRNKKSVVLDLKDADAAEHALELAATADVFVQSLAPGGAEKLGIGYGRCRERNPRLVYCSISGFGATGPLRDELGLDTMLQAHTGIMSFTGEPGRPPIRIPIPSIDLLTGAMALSGVLAALRERDQSGEGQHLEVSLYDTAMAMLLWNIPLYSATGANPKPVGAEIEHLFPNGVFKAKDTWIYIAVATNAHWQRLCRAVARDDLGSDPRFATSALRVQNRETLRPMFNEILDAHTADELVALLKPAGVPTTKVRSVGEAVDEPHAAIRGTVRTLPGYPDVKVAAAPLRMERGMRSGWDAPPDLGADTDAVLADLESRSHT